MAQTSPAPIERDDWYVTRVDGKRIGYLHEQVEIQREDGRPLFRTSTDASFELVRMGSPLKVSTRTSFWETAHGRPERFESVTRFSGQELTSRGERTAEGFAITDMAMGTAQTRTIPWPAEVLFPAAMERQAAAAGWTPGNRLEMVGFLPDIARPVKVTITMKGYETVPVDEDGTSQRLLRIDSQQDFLPGVVASEWRDAGGRIRRSLLPLMGIEIENILTTRDRATKPSQGAEVLMSSLIDLGIELPPPREISRPPPDRPQAGSDRAARHPGRLAAEGQDAG